MPKVNSTSKDIASRYRGKLEDICQTKLSTVDWLMQPSKNPKWQETAKHIVEQEQLRECTFKPDVKEYKKPLNRGRSQEMLSKFNARKESSASKIRSRELMPNTGNKFNDLYELSKNLQQHKKNMDKSTVEYEFEKSKEECTFKP